MRDSNSIEIGHKCCDFKSGVGLYGGAPPFLFTCITCILKLHSMGPFGNPRDKKVLQFIGVPMINL